MMGVRSMLPRSLAGRFALASASLAAVAVLLVAAASWWLVHLQHGEARERLQAREREFHASNVGSSLRALASRMAEVSGSTILATGLVDSAGKETYLAPFLNGIRQVNGIPVQLMFADFAGNEIASNGAASFDSAQRRWMRQELEAGRRTSRIFGAGESRELVAIEPLRYTRTTTPEGAVLYKIALRDIRLEPGLRIEFGAPGTGMADATPIDAPDVFKPLALRLVGRTAIPADSSAIAPLYLSIAILAVAVFTAVFLAGSGLARRLTRDLSALEAFSSRVVTAGAGQQRAPAGGSTEVASLAVSINSMLERLHQQHEALRAEGDKLSALARALQDADRRKDEFLAMLAHELRNPLAPISTGAELLRAHAGTDESVRRTSQVIARQVRHMTKIVDDLLDVSRVTRGLVALERRPVDMTGVASAALDQIRPFADSRRHRMEVSLPQPGPVVMGDPARLVQVASNLLHNACKYTQEGGRIALEVFLDGRDVVLRVSDNGSGIAPDFLPEMFGLFTQGARLPDRSQGGLGLGLPLVKHLVELQGGTVTGKSEGVGCGAEFTVRLPQAESPAVAEPDGAPAPGNPSSEGLRILVVDDNVDAAETLASLLEVQGHIAQVAHDGLAALAAIAQFQPDACVLDIGLPGMDGIELARRLRSTPEGSRAMLIALTGYGQESDRRRSAEAGFDHHLVKPVDAALLEEVLKQQAREESRWVAPR